MKYRLSKSVVLQEIILLKDDPLVYFRTKVDWREDEAVLKARFPTGINARRAVYDIQFGNIERPAHRNTLADHARFEVAAQKWVDLSEGYEGLGVITDSKYGFNVYESCIGITLLRASSSPDNMADRGINEFTYALYPHKGSWREADLPGHAQRMNHPPMVFRGRPAVDRGLDPEKELATMADATGDGVGRTAGVIIETMKVAENGDGIVVRMYECKNSRGILKLKLNLPAAETKRAHKCNLLEEEEKELELEDDGSIRVPYTPYEIITLKILPR